MSDRTTDHDERLVGTSGAGWLPSSIALELAPACELERKSHRDGPTPGSNVEA